MLQNRTGASSVVLNSSTLWIVGGVGDGIHDNFLSSTEFVTLDQPPTKGPDIPFKISEHGMVNYSNNAIYLLSLIHI